MFDKARCIRNIYDLAKKKGLKIGDLEEKAGVSKGYLSRINKEESTSSPSIEVLDSISRQLDVGIDYLVNFSEERLSENEEFVLKFVDKLMRMTLDDQVDWMEQAFNNLTEELEFSPEYPFFFIEERFKDINGKPNASVGYRSEIYTEARVDLVGKCYHAEIAGATVWLNVVCYPALMDRRFGDKELAKRVVEVYLVNNTPAPICSTYFVSAELRKAVWDLYAAAAEKRYRIMLTKNTKSVMENIIDL